MRNVAIEKKIKDDELSKIEDSELGGDDGLSPDYEREMTRTQLELYIDDIADTVRIGLDQSISILTPWFFNNMPKIYYQTTPRQEKVRHLSAIITGHVFETKQTVELWDRDKSKVTYIGPGGDRKILLEMARKISDVEVKMGAVYFSRDNLLFLSTFFCSKSKEIDSSNQRILDKIKHSRGLMLQEFPDRENEIDHYLRYLDNDLVMYATAARLSITFRMVNHMLTHQGAHTFVEAIENSPRARLTLGIKNISPSEIMSPVLELLHRYDFNIGRAFVVKLDRGYDESITVIHFILSHESGEKITSSFVPKIRVTKALRSLGWVDHDEFSQFGQRPFSLSINAANLVRSMATWCHIFLSKHDPYAYSLYRIRNTFIRYPKITESLVKVFRIKFDPLKDNEREKNGYIEALKQLEIEISEIIEEVDNKVYNGCYDFIKYCLKTNYFFPTKTGHAFRFAPEILNTSHYAEAPFGIFFITGRDYRFFHLRWRDIARGGMRVVMPRNTADYDYELSGIFDEVYGLSHAQQLKNKDIPEGGSKAVLVLKPKGHRDQAVKGAVNALIDLLVESDESHETTTVKSLDYYKKTEIIYLGPDENITNDLIEWIPLQAKRRGYKYADAIMSSKPRNGINHKDYGVTSEGINVFVENTLKFININPKTQKFSVKLTGGPDGDVAGNELKILFREYGENARVISISDGYGCAYDPEGLSWKELIRLIDGGFSIANFDSAKLKKEKGAFVINADTKENIKIRNEIFMTEYADIFIPAGGRPYTINSKNWDKFIDKDGKPSVKAIVEGANIFFTSEARDNLQKKGVVVIKDSSANKTGVICSSYEIIASLTLSEDEFIEIKEDYIKEVIDILRMKADQEAKLLFKSYILEDEQKSFVELSLEISKEINEITDILLEELYKNAKGILADPLYKTVIEEHCPPIMRAKYIDRIHERLPDSHKIAIISTFIASYIVYKEGLGWSKGIPKKFWYTTLITYIKKDRLTHELIKSVMDSNLENKEQINAILSKSAARDLTFIELEKNIQ